MRTDRLPLTSVLAMLVVAAAACGTSAGPEAIADPRPSTTATSRPLPGPADGDRVVWQEFTGGGGFVPTEYALGNVPDVTIYADGRSIRTVDVPVGRAALLPVALEEAQIPADELAAFLEDAADSGLIEPGTDFGQPGVTDMPSTSITLRTGDTPTSVDVYALDFDIDTSTSDVTGDQVQRREQLKDLRARARSLGSDAAPYVPDRVRAILVADGSQIDAGAGPQDWPGPPLSAFPEPAVDGPSTSCLVIEGPDAAAVTEAAADNDAAFWRIDGEVHQIITAPLVPGIEGCPPA